MWNFYVYIIFINIEPYLLIEIRNIVAKWVFEWNQSLATYCSNSYEIFHKKNACETKNHYLVVLYFKMTLLLSRATAMYIFH